MRRLLLPLLLLLAFTGEAQTNPFRFAFITDTHIGSPNGNAEEDLRRTVEDINQMSDVAFVVVTGDITELGTNEELKRAKEILDALKVPYYIIPGNHDTGWSESGGLSFTQTFGNDRFHFVYNGIHFIANASGPYVRMSDGHVPRSAMNWMAKELEGIAAGAPIVFLNHYPLDNGLDNWYEVIDLLKQKNTVLALCGHGHNNRAVQAEGLPAVMGRSNLRAKAAEGGYNLVDVRPDSILFTERKPLSKTGHTWMGLPFVQRRYDLSEKHPRPDYSVNQTYASVKPKWTYSSTANVISTPAATKDLVVFGNQNGLIEAVSKNKGKRRWQYQTNGPIYSSPAVAGRNIVIASADSFVYCLNTKGKLQWKFQAGASVLGSPLIEENIIYIGASDHRFYALDLQTGKPVWTFEGLKGPVVSKPTLYKNTLLFGAWDRNLYALDKQTGTLLWQWSNGSPVINYSPAACIPVVHQDVVYVVAPDRYLSAIDMTNGQTLWRTNEATVRESLGLSADGQWIYGKTMNDYVVAYPTSREKQAVGWKVNAGFGYEHVPSMLIEKEGKVFFGTKNGVVYSLNPQSRQVHWAHKIDNSMVNTVNPLSGRQVIAATMDGKVCLLQEK